MKIFKIYINLLNYYLLLLLLLLLIDIINQYKFKDDI
jgi:hypothetical protein